MRERERAGRRRTLAAAHELDPDLLVDVLGKVEDVLPLGLIAPGPGCPAASSTARGRATSASGGLAASLKEENVSHDRPWAADTACED